MIEEIKVRYIILYILFVALQLLIFSPKLVVGTNVPILFTYLFGLVDNHRIVRLRNKINFDTTFLAILLSISSVILIFSDVVFIGTSLFIITFAILWKTTEE